MDTIVLPISDLHSGGTTSLFPKKFMQFEHVNHTPTDDQKRMFDHWAFCAKEVKKARKGKRLIIVHDGDAIEGAHHGSLQIITPLHNEQIDIHVDLMVYFLDVVEFDRRRDRLYYVKGTESHANDAESIITDDLNAIPNKDGNAWDELKLTINGKRVWFTHHGTTAGRGANRGNSMRNRLRDWFHDERGEGCEPPHYVITGHTHDPYWNVFIGRHNGKYHCIHGLICPSWQIRTRYGHRAAPLQQGKIGLQYFEITKDGHISEPVELLMK